MTISPEAAFGAAEAVTRGEGSNFYWGFRFLSKEMRRRLFALYAFARRSDDIVDGSEPTDEKRISIDEWRKDLEEALIDPASAGDPVLAAIGLSARDVPLTRSCLLELVDGCAQDLDVRRYETYEDLSDYCRKVACTVGLLMLDIFASRNEETDRTMTALGHAFQMTNIIRDIPEDYSRDRVYLPLEDLERFGVREESLGAGPAEGPLLDLIEFEVERTEGLYQEASLLPSLLEKGPARTMKAMILIYGGILAQIRARRFDVFSRRPSLSVPRKAWLTMKASLLV